VFHGATTFLLRIYNILWVVECYNTGHLCHGAPKEKVSHCFITIT
jgi:hypothetical protein